MILALFLTFLKIGLFTFGGGYAMISIIENICVEQKKWITHEDMMNITVVAESTPGPIAINSATFVGYKQKGVVGAIAATLGVVLPSFIIIFIIALFLDNFMEIAWIVSAFKGIRIAVGILIVDAAIKMIKKMPTKIVPCSIMVAAFTAMMLINFFSWSFSSISLMLIAGVTSLVIYTIQSALPQKGGDAK